MLHNQDFTYSTNHFLQFTKIMLQFILLVYTLLLKIGFSLLIVIYYLAILKLFKILFPFFTKQAHRST
jgi:hypothetical protein